jgi:hypothetical protein
VRIFGCALIAILTLALGCKERSGGTRIFSESAGLDSESSYFADPTRKVGYCVSRSAQFGVSDERFDALLLEALSTWKEYLKARAYEAAPLSHKLIFKVNSLQYEKRPCENADLIFFLGKMDHPKVKGVACGLKAPGAAFKIENKIAERWSRSLIWLSNDGTLKKDLEENCAQSSLNEIPAQYPDWKASENINLKAVLIHELGHVLGFRHTDGSIMSEKISRLIENPTRHTWELTHIDWQRVLLSLEPRDSLSIDLPVETDKQRADLFRKISGREPTGKITGRLNIKDGRISFALLSGDQTVWLTLKPGESQQNGPETYSFQFRSEEIQTVWPVIANEPWTDGERMEGLYLRFNLHARATTVARIEGTETDLHFEINPSNIETSYYVFFEDPETFDEIPLFIAKPFPL